VSSSVFTNKRDTEHFSLSDKEAVQMNQDFLTQIRTTEEEAANLIDRARQDSRRKTQEAREKTVEKLAAANQEAVLLQQEILDRAEKKAEAIRIEAKRQAETEVSLLNQSSAGKIPDAARIIVERIVKDCADC
jgi:vacuolar-type H+-ATPase subunit H